MGEVDEVDVAGLEEWSLAYLNGTDTANPDRFIYTGVQFRDPRPFNVLFQRQGLKSSAGSDPTGLRVDSA